MIDTREEWVDLGNTIRDIRVRKGLTQKELSELLGVSKYVVGKHELATQHMSLERAREWAEVLGNEFYIKYLKSPRVVASARDNSRLESDVFKGKASFGATLQYYMGCKKLSTKELADAMEVSRESVCRWLRDEYIPTKFMSEDLTDILNHDFVAERKKALKKRISKEDKNRSRIRYKKAKKKGLYAIDPEYLTLPDLFYMAMVDSGYSYTKLADRTGICYESVRKFKKPLLGRRRPSFLRYIDEVLGSDLAGHTALRSKQAGAFIRKQREAKGLTGVELASKLSATSATVSLWEHGRRMPTRKDLVSKIREILSFDRNIWLSEIGFALKGRRLWKGLSIDEFAGRLGVGPSEVEKWEDHKEWPPKELHRKIKSLIGIDVAEYRTLP